MRATNVVDGQQQYRVHVQTPMGTKAAVYASLEAARPGQGLRAPQWAGR